MSAKINLASFSAALFLFFVPWLDFKCAGNAMFSQSGVQATYGGGSLSPQFEKMLEKSAEDKDENKGGKEQNSLGVAVFVALALFVVIAAFVISLLIFRGAAFNPLLAPMAGGVAIILIGLQMMLGFPVETKIAEDMSSKNQGAQDEGNSFAEMGEMVSAMNIGVEYRPWIYLELASLACPLLFAFFGAKPKKADAALEEDPALEIS